MSFKYRFILSFVLLEAFFIILIVTMNFIAIHDSSEKLTNEKIESNLSFLEELVKIPVSIYDLATLDNLITNSSQLKYINSIVVLDSQDKVLSKVYDFTYKPIDEILEVKENKSIVLKEGTFEIRYKKLIEEDTVLGSLYIIFDTSETSEFIENSMTKTIAIIIIEILVSTILSYFIGSRLTIMLTRLSEAAKEIGEYKYPEIPYQNKTDEIGILSKSMAQMLVDLKTRRDKLKNLAKELNTQKNELIEMSKSKDDFLANMSHELKTPLNSINVISSVMMKNRKGKLDEEQIKNLTIINRCGNDLLFLINDVLDISKLEAGEVTLDEIVVDFEDMMREIHDMFEPQVKQKGLNFVYEIPTTINKVFTDKNRIKQIVKNLLSNAIKFVENGSIKLIARDLGDSFEIAVIDDGIGISEDKLEHIFDRFKQADGSTTRKYGGTGLGLAICKELSNLLGGDITVESKVGVGTTFKVFLPKNLEKINENLSIELPKESVLENIEEEKTESSEETVLEMPSFETHIDKEVEEIEKQNISEIKGNKKPNVILLNDDPLAFISVAISLKTLCEFEQVNKINELFEKVKNNSYDFVIIDVSKVDLDLLKTEVNDLGLRFVAVCDDLSKIDEELKQSISNIFEKPIDKDALLNIIKG